MHSKAETIPAQLEVIERPARVSHHYYALLAVFLAIERWFAMMVALTIGDLTT
jgi:hypothetical protein